MIQFYAPEIAVTPVLPEGESHHCVKVLRRQPGDPLEVIDGRGGVYSCRLLEAHPKHAQVEILSRREEPLPWNFEVTIGVAPTKHLDRMEWLMEKLTEVGINRLIPLRGDRSERKELKIERLEKIAVSAMKQSLKASMPRIDEMTPISRVITSTTASQRFICYCSDEVERRLLSRELRPGSDVCILIGPEGDFSPAEVNLALENGFIPVSLGDSRLRTETAALFAASIVQIINQLKI
ncbi:MAG: 16S rRNA (uracil(1498)-N(3))-methyltransferase [Bacteroides sp.]|nr:16S rRNA (uracil(1498)-N(3))-methyltransferase [Bacteroides sp.]